MFTPLKYNYYNNLHLFHSNYHHKTPTRDVQNDAVSSIFPSMIKLTRFNLNNRPNSVFQIIKPVSLTSPMADAVEKFETPPSSPPPTPTPQVSEKEEKTVEPPTPPEKPEAGDCCGSGCVRCVWDVYYDELEDYNQLLQEYNNNNNNNNSSTKNS